MRNPNTAILLTFSKVDLFDASNFSITFSKLYAFDRGKHEFRKNVVGIEDQGLEHPLGCDKGFEILSDSGQTLFWFLKINTGWIHFSKRKNWVLFVLKEKIKKGVEQHEEENFVTLQNGEGGNLLLV